MSSPVQHLKHFPKNLSVSIGALLRLLYFKPAYLFLALASAALFYEIIFWFLNLGLAGYLLTSPYLSVLDRLEIIKSSFSGIFGAPFSLLATLLFIVALLQGVATSALTYLIRKERKFNRSFGASLGGAGAAGVFAVLGLGCAACGTSLVTPLLTLLFASSSVALAEQVGMYSAAVALVAAMVSAYLSGRKLADRLEV